MTGKAPENAPSSRAGAKWIYREVKKSAPREAHRALYSGGGCAIGLGLIRRVSVLSEADFAHPQAGETEALGGQIAVITSSIPT